MKKVIWEMSIGFVGAVRTGELEFENDATKDEIDEAVNDAAMQYVDIGWECEDDA